MKELLKSVSKQDEFVVVLSSTGRKFKVPCSEFKPNLIASPDFNKLSIGDYGMSLVLGDYECDGDFILDQKWEIA